MTLAAPVVATPIFSKISLDCLAPLSVKSRTCCEALALGELGAFGLAFVFIGFLLACVVFRLRRPARCNLGNQRIVYAHLVCVPHTTTRADTNVIAGHWIVGVVLPTLAAPAGRWMTIPPRLRQLESYH